MSWVKDWSTGVQKDDLIGILCKLLENHPPISTQLGGIKELEIHTYNEKTKAASNVRILLTQQDIDAIVKLYPKPFTFKKVKGFEYPRVIAFDDKNRKRNSVK